MVLGKECPGESEPFDLKTYYAGASILSLISWIVCSMNLADFNEIGRRSVAQQLQAASATPLKPFERITPRSTGICAEKSSRL
jgi:uncharacterized protein YggT (Ycf19 family)